MYIVQVGTLDSLMQLSDDLVRIDMLVENIVRKIEKQYVEVTGEQPASLKVSVYVHGGAQGWAKRTGK